jgi:hypothetical protein
MVLTVVLKLGIMPVQTSSTSQQSAFSFSSWHRRDAKLVASLYHVIGNKFLGPLDANMVVVHCLFIASTNPFKMAALIPAVSLAYHLPH